TDLLVDEPLHAVPKIGFAFAEAEVHLRSPILLSDRWLDRTAYSVKRLCRSKCAECRSQQK
ncbi:hypothetical protein, partial [Pseudomonas sp. EA_65y_Pfl1_P113]|uniref:hypothetical protein n=1 Tax=Pseudomonas sp. EA_65y_Pfl1_P113 TaxID=3088692 RepID=UPI0030DAEECA